MLAFVPEQFQTERSSSGVIRGRGRLHVTPRGMKRRSMQWLDLLLWLVAGCGIALTAPLLRTVLPAWPDPQQIGLPTFWTLLAVSVVVALYGSIAVHELGHLLMAVLLRYHVVMISVGAFGLARSQQGWHWRQVHANWLAMRGSTVVLQPQATHHRRNELLVILSGPLAQLLLLVGLLVMCRGWQSAPPAAWLVLFMHSTIYLTFLGLCSSLMPLRVGMISTDAYHALQLFWGGAGVERQLLIQRLTARLFIDTPYGALDPSVLAAACTPDDASRNTYAANLLATAHALDNDDGAKAADALNRVLTFVHTHRAARQAGWPFLYAARYELRHGGGPAVADQWLALVGDPTPGSFRLDVTQAQLAIRAESLHAMGNDRDALVAAQQSLALLPYRLDRGGAIAEQRRLQQLTAQLTPRVPLSAPQLPATTSTPRLVLRTALHSGASLILLTLLATLF